jgi:hypothetical protein
MNRIGSFYLLDPGLNPGGWTNQSILIMPNNFQQQLEMGKEGEDIVYEYLSENNSLVEDNRSKNYLNNKGPRLIGTDGSLVLPDFVVYNKNPKKGNYAIDVKVKNSLYTINGKKCFTVDRKFEDYKRVVQIRKLDFLAIIFMFEGRLYFYKDSDVFDTYNFNNEYSKGPVYLFEYNRNKQIY